VAALGDENFCRFNVSVDDPFCVGGIECVGSLDRYRQQTLRCQRTISDHVLEGHALEIFHGDKSSSLVLADFVDSANIGMVERRRRASFAAKSLQSLGVLRNIFRQKLQGDKAAE
jgi:hypothetical protein